jgi:hypothetical protein
MSRIIFPSRRRSRVKMMRLRNTDLTVGSASDVIVKIIFKEFKKRLYQLTLLFTLQCIRKRSQNVYEWQKRIFIHISTSPVWGAIHKRSPSTQCLLLYRNYLIKETVSWDFWPLTFINPIFIGFWFIHECTVNFESIKNDSMDTDSVLPNLEK